MLKLDPSTLGWALGQPSGKGEMRAWFGLADGRDADLSLLLAVDALPPTAFEIGISGWVPTVELTVHIRCRPAPGPSVCPSPPATSPAASWRRTRKSGTARTGWWRSRGSWRGYGSAEAAPGAQGPYRDRVPPCHGPVPASWLSIQGKSQISGVC